MTYYELLGVSPTASPDEVHSAYRRAVRRYHPDVNRAPNAAQVTMRLNEAWATLSNGSTRAAYDRSLRQPENAFVYQASRPQAGAWQPPPPTDWDFARAYVPYRASRGYRLASIVYGGVCCLALFAFVASAVHWLPLVAMICGGLMVARVFGRVMR